MIAKMSEDNFAIEVQFENVYGKETCYSVPADEAVNPETWVHEFTEDCLCALLKGERGEYPPNIVLCVKGPKGDGIRFTFGLQHILVALHTSQHIRADGEAKHQDPEQIWEWLKYEESRCKALS